MLRLKQNQEPPATPHNLDPHHFCCKNAGPRHDVLLRGFPRISDAGGMIGVGAAAILRSASSSVGTFPSLAKASLIGCSPDAGTWAKGELTPPASGGGGACWGAC